MIVVRPRSSWLIASLLAVVAVLAIMLSRLSFESFKGALDLLAADGNADQVTRALHARVTLLLLLVGAGAFAAMLLWLFFGPQLSTRVSRLTASFTGLAREARANYPNWIANESRFHLVTLAAICAMGTALRIYHLFQPMRSDESWTYLNYVSEPLVLAVSLYDSPNNHVLHTVLAHLCTALFGDEAWVTRLPAFIAGTLLIPAGYFLFRTWFGTRAALLTAGVLAVWPALIDYSTNARGYSMVMLLSLLLLIAADRIRRRADPAAYAIFACLAALGLYTIPVFAFPIGAAGMWLLLSAFADRVGGLRWQAVSYLFWTAIVAVVLSAMLYLPVLVTSGASALFANDVLASEAGATILQRTLPRLADVWSDWHQGVPLAVELMLGVAGVWTVLRYSAIASHRVPLWLPLVLWCAIVVAIGGTLGPPRVYLFTLPLYLGLAAVGCVQLVRLRPQLMSLFTLSATAAACTAIAWYPPGHLYREFGAMPEAERLVLTLASELREGDGLVTTFPANKPVNYYAKRHGLLTAVGGARAVADVGDRRPVPARLWVILNSPGETLSQAFDYHNGIAGAAVLRVEQYETLTVKTIGDARLVSLRPVQPLPSGVYHSRIANPRS